jgi:hypothetical protein
MRRGERFHEIAHLQALLHDGRIVDHKPSYHPARAIPSQNPFTFRNRLRLHSGLAPKLTDRWVTGATGLTAISEKSWGGPAAYEQAANGLAISLARGALSALPFFRMDLESTVIAVNGIDCQLQCGKRGN